MAWCPAGLSQTVPPPPVIPPNLYNVTNYGAIGDGVTTNTTAIQNTINAASAAGGGTVEIPAPGTYESGPLNLSNSINLQIDGGAVLQMLPYGNYPTNNGSPADFIYASRLHDLEVSGSGTIDGQGSPWWTAYNANKNLSRPKALIAPSTCTRVLIQGITLQNPPNTHISLRDTCVNATVQNITVNTTGNSPNTDGMDVSATNCLVQNCSISDGDDNIALGGFTAGMLVTNCAFGAGHGMSIGSYTDSGGVSNVTVINCTFNGTGNGIRLKSDNDRGGLVQNIDCFNLGMTNILTAAIVIYSYYSSHGTPDNITPAIAAGTNATPITTTTPIWQNIVISNVTATVAGGGIAGIIWGRTEMPVTNVILSKVKITAPGTFDLYNAYGVSFINSSIIASGYTTFTLYNAGVTISNTTAAAAVTMTGLTSTNSLALYNAPATIGATGLYGENPVTVSGCILSNSTSLTLGPTDAVNFVLGTNAAKIGINGSLTPGGATVNVSAGPGFAATNYPLFTYTGSLNGSPVLGTTPTNFPSYSYSLNTNTAGQIRVLVTQTSPPDITQFGVMGGNLVLSGTGGPDHGGYYVLTSTNVALPMSNWTQLATGQFDAGGNFIFSNAITPNLPAIFYRLQLP